MRKSLVTFLAGFLLLAPSLARAQKVYCISALVGEDQFVPAFEGFKGKMSELGYVDGKNVKYDFHNAKGDIDLLKKLAQKIVEERPDLIVTSSTTATIPVAKLTEGSGLPVVFLSAGNPLKFVKSYASSGNNLAGITSSSLDLTEKRLELFRQLAPALARVVFIRNPSAVNYEEYIVSTHEAAKRLGLTVAEIEIHAMNADEVNKRLSLVTRQLGEALFIPPDAIFVSAIESIAHRAVKEKLLSVGLNVQTVRRGLLAAYSSDYYSLGQQGAKLVDKILRGARPTDLPIEQPYKLDLVINLKTAKAIGVKVPKEMLLRADELIE